MKKGPRSYRGPFSLGGERVGRSGGLVRLCVEISGALPEQPHQCRPDPSGDIALPERPPGHEPLIELPARAVRMERPQHPGERAPPIVAGEHPAGAGEELGAHSDGPAAGASASGVLRVRLFGGV